MNQRLTNLRIWCSYQRYVILLVAVAVAIAAPTIASGNLIAIFAAAVPVIALLGFATSISLRFKDKMRATHIATKRIEQGRFRSESVRQYCGDPCFRVVAAECLARAGIARPTRQEMIRRFRRELDEEPAMLLLRDPRTGRTIIVGGQTEPS